MKANNNIFQENIWLKFTFDGMQCVGRTYINKFGYQMVAAVIPDMIPVTKDIPFILCSELSKLNFVPSHTTTTNKPSIKTSHTMSIKLLNRSTIPHRCYNN